MNSDSNIQQTVNTSRTYEMVVDEALIVTIQNEREEMVKERNSWRKISLALVGLLFLVLAANIVSDQRTRVEPYVIASSDDGRARAIPLSSDVAQLSRDSMIKRELEDLVIDVFTFYGDGLADNARIWRAYRLIDANTEGGKNLESYLVEQTEQKVRQKVEKISVFPVANNTWQIDWTVTNKSYGTTVEKTGRLEIEDRSKTGGSSNENPLGIYVYLFEWTDRHER